jgi:uncharacterized protein YgiB involved in biofilm formation
MTKRSSHVHLVLAGAAVLGLAACEDDRVDVSTFADQNACVEAAQSASAGFTAGDCEQGYAKALSEHERTGPRYTEKALCEEQHGGSCEMVTNSSGGPSFMPFFLGYMMGSNSSSSSHAGPYSARPLYRNSSGSYATASGTTVTKRLGTSAKIAPAGFRAPTIKAPMTRATVARSGGFGASRTAVGSGSRSFGG